MIEQFITLLQQHGLAITGGEVADILWFATKLSTPIASGEKSNATDGKRNSGFAESKPNQSQSMHHEPPDKHRKRPTTLQNQRQKIDVYSAPIDNSSDDNQTKPARSVRLPAAPALPGGLDISRSLRPLMRRVPSRTIFLLDETATAQHIADTDDWTPILYPEPRPWLDVVLVADESSSMTMWQHTIHELRRLLERQGAFRNIYLWGLTPGPDGYGVHLHSGLGGIPNSNRSRDPRELFDHHGQRLILLVSDCVALAWHNGTMPELLAEWGKYGMTALVQMLPEPLWSRTGLRHFPAILMRSDRPGTPNCQLSSEWMFQRLDQPSPAGIAVPVFALDPTAIVHWAHMLVGNPHARVRGILLPFDLNAPEKNAVTKKSSNTSFPPTLSATELLHLFHTRASPIARHLAGLLATLSPLSLPVMRLVQRAMLPDSKQVDLAEVLLSGLIKRVTPIENSNVPTDQVEYRFVDNDIRERLRSTVRISEVDQVRSIVESLSAYIERHWWQIQDFQAFVEDLSGSTGNTIRQGQQIVAQVRSDMIGVADVPSPETDKDAEDVSTSEQLQQSKLSDIPRDLQRELLELIQLTDLSLDDLMMIARKSVPAAFRISSSNLEQLLYLLWDLPVQSNHWSPLLEFVERLAAQTIDPKVSDKLRTWSEEVMTSSAHEVGTPADLEKLRSELTIKDIEPAIAYLQIELIPDRFTRISSRNTGTRYTIQISLWQENAHFSRLLFNSERNFQLREVSRLIYQVAEENIAQMNNLIIFEFFLPTDLLLLPTDSWVSTSEQTLGSKYGIDYPIILRSLDRLNMRNSWKMWRENWSKFISGSDKPVVIDTSSPRPSIALPMYTTPDVPYIVFTSQPRDVSILTQYISAGVPVMIWPNVSETNSIKESQILEEIVLLSPKDLYQLTRFTQNKNIRSIGNTRSWKYNLTILWDDPNRIPARYLPEAQLTQNAL